MSNLLKFGFTFLAVAEFSVAAFAATRVDFRKDVLPILSDKCFHCHGPDAHSRKAKLRLDQPDWTQESKLLIPGQPENSEFFRRITTLDPDDKMPPPENPKSLSPTEIRILDNWIQEGADWDEHWAFITPKTPTPPEVENVDQVRNPIDSFIVKKLEEQGLQPSPPADRYTLIRRLSYDLTGMPPALDEIDDYVNDTSPHAYETLVDRLLESPQFGERMALAWLDIARYGDSSVFHADGPRFMWPWRDWVIEAYNSNMPFDQFTKDQIAGDLIPDGTRSQKLATGFNRNHGTTDEGGAIDEEYRVEYVVDRVKTTASTWLGLTMECAQCHDHKYDPISQEEYYQFYAYFNRTKDRGMQTRNGNAEPVVYLYTEAQEATANHLRSQLKNLRQTRKSKKAPDEQVQKWIEILQEAGRQELPSLSTWQTLGPFQANDAAAAFKKDFGPEKAFPIDPSKALADKSWIPKEEYEDGKPHTLPIGDNSALYLHRTLKSTTTQIVSISLGSDDGIKLWHNGKQVLANDTARGVAADQEKVDLKLTEGQNEILLKINNRGGGAGFYFKLEGPSVPEDIQMLATKTDDQRSEEEFSKLVDYYTKNLWSRGLQLDEEIKSTDADLKSLMGSVTTSMIMEDQETPRKTYVLNRGHYASPIKDREIEPNTPSFLPSLSEAFPQNRLGLAEWLTHPNHPLTARVAVNRYWTMIFGNGIVSTISDFGVRSEPPSHPALLDWLATDFIENGWNIKRTMKQMVMSATYRQSSKTLKEHLEKDPINRYLARAPRLRLQGEFIRDTALYAANLLDLRIGGPSVKPYQPARIWNEVSLNGGLFYKPDSGRKLYRKSMYTYWKRSAPMPNMMAFDAPTREKCTIQRQRTNTPLQALVTMNDVQWVESARLFAKRILHSPAQTFKPRLDYAFQIATGRPVDESRISAMKALYQSEHQRFSDRPEDATRLLEYGEYPHDTTLDPIEHATWTLLASAILNLDETISKD